MKKTVYVLNMILTVVVAVMAVIILFSAITARQKEQVPKLFGHSFHIVVSASMEPDIKVGDFVVAKTSTISDVKLGDYVVFKSTDPSLQGMIIIHKVVEINQTDGIISLTTSGITPGATVDRYPVTDIIGIYKWQSSAIGRIVTFLTSTKNLLFTFIVLISFMLIAKYSVSIVNQIKNYKKDK